MIENMEKDFNFCVEKWGKQAEILKFAKFWKLIRISDASAVIFRNQIIGDKNILFGYIDFPNDFEIAKSLFEKMEEESQKLGAEKLIGPMNFAPWLDCKWIVDGWELPELFPEPKNEKYHVDFCKKLGYEEYSAYVSTIVNLDDEQHHKYKKHFEKLTAEGYVFKHYAGEELNSIIQEVYGMTVELFVNEPLHEPLLPQYLEYYMAKFNRIEPVISTCHKDGKLCVYWFSYKNVGNNKLWIFMMGASDEKYRKNGVSVAMRYFGHNYALANDCTHGVHHVIYEQNNASRKFSKDLNVEKRYAIFYKNLKIKN